MNAPMPARVVSAASGARWLLEGWNIFRAAPLPWMALVFVYFFLIVLSASIKYVGAAAITLAMPAISVSFMAIARAAHHRAAIGLELVTEGFRRETRALLVLGVVYGVCMTCIVLIATFYLNVFPDAREATQEPEGGTADLLVLLLMYVPLGMMFWFAPVLTAWHGAPPAKALFFSVAGVLINWRAFLTYGAVSLTAVLALAILALFGARLISPELPPDKLALPVLIAVYPTLLGSYYASYRDIFGYIAPSSEGEKPAR
jgi:hypothetical protein